VTISLLIIGGSCHAHIFSHSPEPRSVEIKLSESGVVADYTFQVRRHFPHWFSIRFWYPESNQVERARIRKLLGGHTVDKDGRPLEPGISTPVSLSILAVCADGREIEIYSQDADPVLSSWGKDYFGKNIGNHVLSTGTYRARLVNKRSSMELSSVRTTFEVSLPAKITFDPKKAVTRINPCQP
jgi:hypothetical protein